MKKPYLSNLFVAEAVKSFALSLVSVFIPIYLYKSGYSIQFILGIMLIQAVIRACLAPLMAYLVNILGSNLLIAISYLMTFAYLLLFAKSHGNSSIVILAAAMWGIANSFYWIAFHVYFSTARTVKRTGKQLSYFDITVQIASALGPFIGGLVAIAYGASTIFVLAAVLVFLGMYPLLSRKTQASRRTQINWRNVHIKRITPDIISGLGDGMNSIIGTAVWPLLIIIVLKTYTRVGLSVTLSLLLSMIIILVIGRLSDTNKRTWLLWFGTRVNSLITLLRIFTFSFVSATILGAADQISYYIMRTPWSVCFYAHSDEEQKVEYITVIVLASNIAAVCSWGLLLVLSYWLSFRTLLNVGLIIGACGMYLNGFMRPITGKS